MPAAAKSATIETTPDTEGNFGAIGCDPTRRSFLSPLGLILCVLCGSCWDQ